MDKIVKILISLSTISTVVLTVLIVAVSVGYAQIDFKMNNEALSEENQTSPNQFFLSQDIASKLDSEFSPEKEFAACLKTSQIVKTTDSNLEVSYLLDGFDSNVNFYGESFSTIGYCDYGTIHSHPKGSCYFSVADIYSFKDRIKKGEFFAALMCGKDKFYYITRNDFKERMLEVR